MADSFPTFSFAFSPTTAPTATPSWVDITAYVRAFSFRRGRTDELERVSAGSGELVLSNRDRRFDPTYTSGTYYGNLLPMRRMRIQATWSAVTYDLFYGYVEGWPQQYPAQGKDTICRVPIVDGFKVLANAVVNASYAEQTSDARIGAVLDTIGWPAGDRSLSTGLQSVQAVTLENTRALEHLLAVAASEGGVLFIDRTGKVAFHDRHRRIKLPITNYLTLGDSSGEYGYSDLEFEYSDRLIINEARVTRDGGVEQVATDATSQAAYYTRSYTASGLPMATDGDAYAMADYLVYNYRQPQLRARPIRLNGAHQTALWPLLLARDVGDRLTLRRRPTGGGNTIEQVSTLEGIEMSGAASQSTWQFVWQVSPADTTAYWQVADATYGVLDSTTRLAY